MTKTTLKILFLFSFAPCAAFAQMDGIKAFTEPFRSIDVAARESGTLSEILVVEGDRVSANQILSSLNDQVLQASLAMARESQCARGKLNSALAELSQQDQRLAKIRGLFDRKHASQTELERAEAQRKVAKAKVESVEDELRIKECEIKRTEAQIEQRRVRSPIDGLVTRVYKDTGEFVSANDAVVMTVVQMNPLIVVFQVPNHSAEYLAAGQTVELAMGTERKPASSVIEYVSPVIDAQSGTCRVKVVINNDDFQWKSGQVCYLKTQQFVSRQSSNRPNGHDATVKQEADNHRSHKK